MPLLWLWRPQRKPPSPVLERNYRCCCNCCSATFGFKMITGFLALLVIIMWPAYIYALFFGLPITGQQWLSLIITSVWTGLGMASIQTMSPYFVQLYLVVLAFSTGLGVISTNLLLLFNVFAYFGDSYEARHQIKRMIGLNHYKLSERHIDQILLGLFFAIFLYLAFALWQLKLVYSFHQYVCDRQLEHEQAIQRRRNEATMIEENQGLELPLHRSAPYVV